MHHLEMSEPCITWNIFCSFLVARGCSKIVSHFWLEIFITHFTLQMSESFLQIIFCQFLFVKFNSSKYIIIYYLIQFLSILSWEEQLCKIWWFFCLFSSPPNGIASRRQFPNTHKSDFSYLTVSAVSALNQQCIKSGESISVKRCYCLVPANERVYRLVSTIYVRKP